MASTRQSGAPTPARAKVELIAALEATLAMLKRAQKDAAAGATHDEAKPEDDKDTRALEQSYLARGQAERVAALEAGLHAVRLMEPRGALVEVEEDGAGRCFFLAPEGGGTRLPCGALVVTPRSPLGQALVGKAPGDEVEVVLEGRRRELCVTRVR